MRVSSPSRAKRAENSISLLKFGLYSGLVLINNLMGYVNVGIKKKKKKNLKAREAIYISLSTQALTTLQYSQVSDLGERMIPNIIYGLIT